ncbi:hypothetical protein SNEBB_006392 [Seison nebaliae]|nr:hypothetical protein SNEBB_006392 [Seison nebaliae]
MSDPFLQIVDVWVMQLHDAIIDICNILTPEFLTANIENDRLRWEAEYGLPPNNGDELPYNSSGTNINTAQIFLLFDDLNNQLHELQKELMSTRETFPINEETPAPSPHTSFKDESINVEEVVNTERNGQNESESVETSNTSSEVGEEFFEGTGVRIMALNDFYSLL